MLIVNSSRINVSSDSMSSETAVIFLVLMSIAPALIGIEEIRDNFYGNRHPTCDIRTISGFLGILFTFVPAICTIIYIIHTFL